MKRLAYLLAVLGTVLATPSSFGLVREIVGDDPKSFFRDEHVEIYSRLLSGEEIDALMREYSDDPGAGIYIMNQARPAPGEFARSLMAKGFGDVSWRLDVGEVGVAPFDPKTSPFGWHVIKRLN